MQSERDLGLIKRHIGPMTIDPRVYTPLIEGRYLPTDAFAEFTPANIDRNVFRGLIFFNCESYQEMKDSIYQEIAGLERFFDEKKPVNFNEFTDDMKFQTHELIPVMNLVEKAMSGKLRRTSEPYFAHTLRVVKRAIDYIKLNVNEQNKKKDLMVINPKTAKALLLMSILHDFHEETYKLDDGQEVSIGDFYFSQMNTENISEVPFIIRRLSADGNEEERTVLNMSGIDIFPLLQGLKTLKYLGDDSQDQFLQINEALEWLNYIKTSSGKVAIWAYLPYLVKIFDRRDNLDTFLFNSKNNKISSPVLEITDEFNMSQLEFIVPSREEITNKMSETIYNLFSAEARLLISMDTTLVFIKNFYSLYDALMDGILAESLMMRNKISKGKSKLFEDDFTILADKYFARKSKRIRANFTNQKILKMLPSRIALLILLGFNPNQIYRENDWSKKGCWVPESI